MVTVEVDDALILYGRVSSNDAIQHAATISLHIHTSLFTLQIRVDHFGFRAAPIFLEQKIDCDKGPCIFLRAEKQLLIQEHYEPEFY